MNRLDCRRLQITRQRVSSSTFKHDYDDKRSHLHARCRLQTGPLHSAAGRAAAGEPSQLRQAPAV